MANAVEKTSSETLFTPAFASVVRQITAFCRSTACPELVEGVEKVEAGYLWAAEGTNAEKRV